MKSLWTIALACLLFAACSDTDDSYDGYANWKARNAEWFAQVLDSARTDIAAKGDNSAWRIRRTLLKTDASNGNDSNYVVMKKMGVVKELGVLSPSYTDTVCLAYRGWLMERMDYVDNDETLSPIKTVFAQTFFGTFNPKTAGIVEAPVRCGWSTSLRVWAMVQRARPLFRLTPHCNSSCGCSRGVAAVFPATCRAGVKIKQ